MLGVFDTSYLPAASVEPTWTLGFAGSTLGVSLLAGVGFTVSLLIGDLAFDAGSPGEDQVKVVALTGSVVAADLAAVVLGRRKPAYRRIKVAGTLDAGGDELPASNQNRV